MNIAQLLTEGFGRIQQIVHHVVQGLPAEALTARPAPDANSIAWLVWHLARVQDDHVADLAGSEQAWRADGWSERFGLPLDDTDIGFGHTSEQVGLVAVGDASLLTGYYDAVHSQTMAYLQGLAEEDLDRVIDRRWDPPVTVGVRLVSVMSDDLQHAGQAAYVRGLLEE